MKNFCLLFLFVLPLSLFSQTEDTGAIDPGAFRLDFIPLGVGYEYQVKERQTLLFNVKLGFATGGTFSTTNENETFLIIAPEFVTQYRVFFNRDKRISKGKTIYNNSGLYFGAHIGYTGPAIYDNSDEFDVVRGVDIAPIFGVQKTWKSNLQLGFFIGPGIGIYGADNIGFSSAFGVNFSYVFVPKGNK